MKIVTLTKGKCAIVDDDDFEFVSQHKWTVSKKRHIFYAYRKGPNVNGKKGPTIYMHRDIVRPSLKLQVDHINGDGLDNRRCNLRLANYQQQQMGFQSKRQSTSSKFRGVYWHKRARKWVAQIKIACTPNYLGLFSNQCDAALAYNAAAQKLFGEFAQLNIVSRDTNI